MGRPTQPWLGGKGGVEGVLPNIGRGWTGRKHDLSSKWVRGRKQVNVLFKLITNWVHNYHHSQIQGHNDCLPGTSWNYLPQLLWRHQGGLRQERRFLFGETPGLLLHDWAWTKQRYKNNVKNYRIEFIFITSRIRRMGKVIVLVCLYRTHLGGTHPPGLT